MCPLPTTVTKQRGKLLANPPTKHWLAVTDALAHLTRRVCQQSVTEAGGHQSSITDSLTPDLFLMLTLLCPHVTMVTKCPSDQELLIFRRNKRPN